MAVGTVLTDESPMLEGGAARVLFIYALRGNHWVGLSAVELINAIVEREIPHCSAMGGRNYLQHQV